MKALLTLFLVCTAAQAQEVVLNSDLHSQQRAIDEALGPYQGITRTADGKAYLSKTVNGVSVADLSREVNYAEAVKERERRLQPRPSPPIAPANEITVLRAEIQRLLSRLAELERKAK